MTQSLTKLLLLIFHHFPHSLWSYSSGLLDAHWTSQAHAYFRAQVLSVPCAWNSFPPSNHMASFPSPALMLTLSERFFLIPPYKIVPLLTFYPHNCFNFIHSMYKHVAYYLLICLVIVFQPERIWTPWRRIFACLFTGMFSVFDTYTLNKYSLNEYMDNS